MGDNVGFVSDRAIHFNSMNPTGYAQIVEELVPGGSGGWQVARTSTIGLDVISTSAASGDRGLFHAYGDDAPMAMLYDAGGSVRALLSPEPGAGSSPPPYVELNDAPGGADDDIARRVQVFDYDAFGQLIRLSQDIGGPSAGPPQADPGGVPVWRFAANTANSEYASAHATFALTTLLYRGEQYDPHLRMQYLRARHYDLGTGRFTRVDPFAGHVRSPLSLHRYTYAHNNPVLFDDPSGEDVYNTSSLLMLQAVRFSTFAIRVAKMSYYRAAAWAVTHQQALAWGTFGGLLLLPEGADDPLIGSGWPPAQAAGRARGAARRLLGRIIDEIPIRAWDRGSVPTGGQVVRNALDGAERAVAQHLADLDAGEFIGNMRRNEPGIDGHWNGVPTQLKGYIGETPYAIYAKAKDAAQRAANAGYRDVTLFIDAPNLSASRVEEFITDPATKLRDVVNDGVVDTIIVRLERTFFWIAANK